jgi:hypothetical protein
MRKFGIFSATIFISLLLAGVYGILHDQITYSISNEYFTKFKYVQFGFAPAQFGGHRSTVAVIGFLATWWVGFFIGVILAFVALIFNNHIEMRKAVVKALIIVFCTAAIFGIIGYLRGHFYLTRTGVNWWLPDNLIDRNKFIIVGSIHNYSYLGGISGLLFSLVYLIRRNIIIRKTWNR